MLNDYYKGVILDGWRKEEVLRRDCSRFRTAMASMSQELMVGKMKIEEFEATNAELVAGKELEQATNAELEAAKLRIEELEAQLKVEAEMNQKLHEQVNKLVDLVEISMLDNLEQRLGRISVEVNNL